MAADPFGDGWKYTFWLYDRSLPQKDSAFLSFKRPWACELAQVWELADGGGGKVLRTNIVMIEVRILFVRTRVFLFIQIKEGFHWLPISSFLGHHHELRNTPGLCASGESDYCFSSAPCSVTMFSNLGLGY